MLLRPAAVDDLEALVTMQGHASALALGHLFPQELHPFPREAVLERWRRELSEPGTAVYLADDTSRDAVPGAITGFAARHDDQLLHFGTAVHTWGTGLAGRLHDELLDTFPTTLTTLRLRVFEENPRARRFWEKHGWRADGHRSRSPFEPHPVLLRYSLTR